MKKINPEFKSEIKKFLSWSLMIVIGLFAGYIVAWTLHMGYKWPTIIIGICALLIMGYGYNGWGSTDCAIYGDDD